MKRNIKNKHPCPENFERYRVLRNKCVKAKLKSQREYFAERCNGGPKMGQKIILAHDQTLV